MGKKQRKLKPQDEAAVTQTEVQKCCRYVIKERPLGKLANRLRRICLKCDNSQETLEEKWTSTSNNNNTTRPIYEYNSKSELQDMVTYKVPDDEPPQGKRTDSIFNNNKSNEVNSIISVNYVDSLRTTTENTSTSYGYLSINVNLIDKSHNSIVIRDVATDVYVDTLRKEPINRLLSGLPQATISKANCIIKPGSELSNDILRPSPYSSDIDSGHDPFAMQEAVTKSYYDVPYRTPNNQKTSVLSQPTISSKYGTSNLRSSSCSSDIDSGHDPFTIQEAVTKSYYDVPYRTPNNQETS